MSFISKRSVLAGVGGLGVGATLTFLALGYPIGGKAAAGFWDWLAHNETSNLATVAGYVLVVVGGVFAYVRWGHDRRIKRIELLMERLRSFEDTPGARNAIMMLYNHDRMIPLWDPDEPPERRYARITWQDVELALVPHPIRPVVFDPKLTAIRDCFEDYLNRLSQLYIFLELGVIENQDARKIMEPWLRRFGLAEQRSNVVRNLRVYIRWRKLEDVQKLFRRFSVDLTDSVVQDWQAIDREVNGEITTDAHSILGIPRPKRDAQPLSKLSSANP